MNRNRYKDDRYGQQHYDNYDYEEDYGNSYHQQHQQYEDDGYDQGVHDFYDTVPATNVARIQVVEQQRGYLVGNGGGGGGGYAKGQQQRYIDGFGGVSGGGSKKKETPNAVRSIINNLKQSDLKQQQQHQQEESPRNRVSTNPFMRANQLQQQQQQQQQSRFDQLPKKQQISKNVAEVVEKMNNGDWPIRIEDDVNVNVNVVAEEKAKQWETLHRKKEEKRQTILESPKGSEKSSSHHEEETTTVSTDSALCSDTAETLTTNTNTRGPSPYKLPFGGPTSDLAEEADRLLGYFKSHREVLNYLGIGLPDRLWQHINKMPSQDIKLQISSTIPKIVTPTPTPIKKQQTAQPIQIISPVPTTTPVSVPPPPPPPITPEFQKQQDLSKGGRFVKKSAAALIAKKQGIVTEDPNSATEIIDPRIAEEIKNLRDREDELKRSRENLNSLSGSGMRGAASYDRLDSDTEVTSNNNKATIERSHSSHNVYIENSNAEFSSSQQRHQHPQNQNQNQSYGAHNYGSMPRTHHQRREERFEAAQVGQQQQQQQYARRDSEQHSNDRGYRATRNPDFFRTPPPSETQNSNRPKSAATFETKSPYHTGLQLPPANVSISTYQRPNTTNSGASKGVYGKFEQRKMGL